MKLLIASIIASALITLIALPYWIKRAKKRRLVGTDMNKFKPRKVPELGGIIVSFGAICGILLFIALGTFTKRNDYSFYLLATVASILIATLIGLVDDILGWKIGLKQSQKAILTVLIALPIMVINAGQSTMNFPIIGSINLGLIYPLFIVPIAIIGASNGFNMLAGYNGLEAGMGIIILSTLAYISWLINAPIAMIIALCFVAALAVFLVFNKYPAKIFGGDTLTYPVGTAIAIVAILGNIEKFALVLFIPYFFEFALKARGFMQKESFAKPLKNGSLVNQYKKWYGLEHIIISLLRTVKKKAFEYEVVLCILALELIIVFLMFL